MVIIPGDRPKEEIDGYGGKDFEKRKVLRRERKCHEKGQQAVQDQSMTMEKSWVMMKDRTDKEHKETLHSLPLSEMRRQRIYNVTINQPLMGLGRKFVSK